MKLSDNKLKQKDINYYSYGVDYEENGNCYYYLQTASNGYEDYEIISSKYKLIPLIVGCVIAFITRKSLVKWL